MSKRNKKISATDLEIREPLVYNDSPWNDFSGFTVDEMMGTEKPTTWTSGASPNEYQKYPPNELIDEDLTKRENELQRKEKKLKKEQEDFKAEQEKLETERKKIAEEKAVIEKERAELEELRKKIEEDNFKKSELNELGDFPT